jgi:hypothetical protein
MADETAGTPAVMGAERSSGAEKDLLPPGPPPRNHGRTVAAWTTTTVVIVGAVAVALGMTLSQPVLTWVGAAVVVAGLVVGGVLRALGHGQPDLAADARRSARSSTVGG